MAMRWTHQCLVIILLFLGGFVVLRDWQGLRAFELLADDSPRCSRKESANLQKMAHDMNAFFQEANIMAHPWVLTMVAALRYGANSVEIDGRVHTVDHDIDLRIVRPKGMTADDLVGNVTAYLQQAGHWVRGFPQGIKSVGQGNPALVFFGASTRLGWMQATQMLPRKVAYLIKKSRLGSDKLPIIGGFVEAAGTFLAYPIGSLFAPLWSLVTVVDLHWDYAESFEGNMVDPNRSLLWAGQNWPFPLEGERVFRSRFVKYVKALGHADSKLGEKLTEFCDFYLPKGRWIEDLSESSVGSDVSRQCGATLTSAGYFSFGQVCETSSTKPVEMADWHRRRGHQR